MSNFHKPVLLKEAILGLRVERDKKYIDATLGGGGHTLEIAKRGGVVLGIDVDQDAIDYTGRRWNVESRKWNIEEKNLTLVRGNFRDIDKIALDTNFDHVKRGFEKVAGVIFDLGVSSHQIDSPTRGFSFQNEGPLDMRMDQELGVRARDLIKILTKGELYEIFTKFGEENRAWVISEHIVRARSIKPIDTTGDLAQVIEEAVGRGKYRKVFQALRIVVNDELNSITEALPKSLGLLEKNGRLCVISFHSLEDRIVKRKFIEFEEKGLGKIITKKPIVPGEEELRANNRARSAKLRIFALR